MAEAFKVLGQSAPTATTNTDVYTVGASTEAIISAIAVCNQAGSAGTARVAIRPDGATITQAHYIAYDVSVPANDTLWINAGVTIDATDVVTVYVSSGNFSVSVFGTEIT